MIRFEYDPDTGHPLLVTDDAEALDHAGVLELFPRQVDLDGTWRLPVPDDPTSQELLLDRLLDLDRAAAEELEAML